jgi:transposase
MNGRLVSIDLAKNVFQVCVLNEHGRLVSNKRVSRAKLRTTLAQIAPATVVMESCYSANYWGREFEQMGHTVKLVPAQHVKPFVRGSKNDANDALAIAEAAGRPKIRFVPVKSVAQQDIQLLHRIRSRHIRNRTALVNQLRGLLSEYGVIAPKGWSRLKLALPGILEDGDNGLSPVARQAVAELYDELLALTAVIGRDKQKLASHLHDCADFQRLKAIPGFGLVLASATVAAIGSGHQFTRAREMAAWIGLTPKQFASGEKSYQGGITKRGDRYLRTLFIHAARALYCVSKDRDQPLIQWAEKVAARRGKNKAIVALAHKLARIAWVVLARQEDYRPRVDLAA